MRDPMAAPKTTKYSDVETTGETTLCTSCLCPNPPDTPFCRHCGAPVGFISTLGPMEQLYAQGALATEGTAQAVFVEGASNLVINEQDKERLRQLLATLEERQRIVDLLSAYLDARQEAVRVVVGLEDAVPHLNNFVLIGTPARVGDEVIGSLAVIGPTRLDYEHTITAVSYIARMFDQFWNESS